MDVDLFLKPLRDPLVLDETQLTSNVSVNMRRANARRRIERYWEDRLLKDNLRDMFEEDVRFH